MGRSSRGANRACAGNIAPGGQVARRGRGGAASHSRSITQGFRFAAAAAAGIAAAVAARWQLHTRLSQRSSIVRVVRRPRLQKRKTRVSRLAGSHSCLKACPVARHKCHKLVDDGAHTGRRTVRACRRSAAGDLAARTVATCRRRAAGDLAARTVATCRRSAAGNLAARTVAASFTTATAAADGNGGDSSRTNLLSGACIRLRLRLGARWGWRHRC